MSVSRSNVLRLAALLVLMPVSPACNKPHCEEGSECLLLTIEGLESPSTVQVRVLDRLLQPRAFKRTKAPISGQDPIPFVATFQESESSQPAPLDPRDVHCLDAWAIELKQGNRVRLDWQPATQPKLTLPIKGAAGWSLIPASPLSQAPQDQGRSFTLGDVNGDGHIDVIGVFQEGTLSRGKVTVFYGTGDGQFERTESVSVGVTPYAVSLADLNNDKRPDLLIGSTDRSTSVHHALQGLQGFDGAAIPLTATEGDAPHSLAAGDFNGDGKTDLAVVYEMGTSIRLFKNTSGSLMVSFLEVIEAAKTIGPAAMQVKAVDLDKNGQMDLIVSRLHREPNEPNKDTNVIWVGRNTGSGFIFDWTAGDLGNRSALFAIEDIALNRQNVLVATQNSSTSFASANAITLVTGLMQSKFNQQPIDLPTASCPITFPRAIAVADYNGDQIPDISVTGFEENASLCIFPGDGSLLFEKKTAQVLKLGCNNPLFLQAADLNEDCRPDLIVSCNLSNTKEDYKLKLFLNKSN